jgi:hypothetical protein
MTFCTITDIYILKSIFNPNDTKNGTEKACWARFTYFGKETRAIIKVLKNTNIKVAYANRNTIGKLLSKKHNPHKDKYEHSGICQLTCPTCHMKYTGQTGKSFRTRFKEHLRDFRH